MLSLYRWGQLRSQMDDPEHVMTRHVGKTLNVHKIKSRNMLLIGYKEKAGNWVTGLEWRLNWWVACELCLFQSFKRGISSFCCFSAENCFVFFCQVNLQSRIPVSLVGTTVTSMQCAERLKAPSSAVNVQLVSVETDTSVMVTHYYLPLNSSHFTKSSCGKRVNASQLKKIRLEKRNTINLKSTNYIITFFCSKCFILCHLTTKLKKLRIINLLSTSKWFNSGKNCVLIYFFSTLNNHKSSSKYLL